MSTLRVYVSSRRCASHVLPLAPRKLREVAG
jgi:hypothetical protein